jgi:hypothetical protein
LSFSATMVYPEVCCKSSPDGETRLPVARKYASLDPTSQLVLVRTVLKYLAACESLSINNAYNL